MSKWRHPRSNWIQSWGYGQLFDCSPGWRVHRTSVQNAPLWGRPFPWLLSAIFQNVVAMWDGLTQFQYIPWWHSTNQLHASGAPAEFPHTPVQELDLLQFTGHGVSLLSSGQGRDMFVNTWRPWESATLHLPCQSLCKVLMACLSWTSFYYVDNSAEVHLLKVKFFLFRAIFVLQILQAHTWQPEELSLSSYSKNSIKTSVYIIRPATYRFILNKKIWGSLGKERK